MLGILQKHLQFEKECGIIVTDEDSVRIPCFEASETGENRDIRTGYVKNFANLSGYSENI